jgi:GNAT superfamily N-acetyltransferase
MPLPILNLPPPPPDNDVLVRYFHQTERHSTEHLAEANELDIGLAFANPAMSKVHDANRIMMASLPDGMSPQQALELVEAHYAAQGVRCWRWIMNPSAPASRSQPLVEFLRSRGFKDQREDVLYLKQMPGRVVMQSSALTIIPARASYRHARQLAEVTVANREPDEAAQLVEAALAHLDDPHYDALIALKDGIAVAKVGVLAAGEIGRIEPLFVAEPFRRQGIGRTMMARALEICARSLFKHVFLSCMPDNAPAQSLYMSLGFVKIAEINSYLAPT